MAWRDFVGDAVLDWEPVKVTKGWGDVLLGPGVSENPGS